MFRPYIHFTINYHKLRLFLNNLLRHQIAVFR